MYVCMYVFTFLGTEEVVEEKFTFSALTACHVSVRDAGQKKERSPVCNCVRVSALRLAAQRSCSLQGRGEGKGNAWSSKR